MSAFWHYNHNVVIIQKHFPNAKTCHNGHVTDSLVMMKSLALNEDMVLLLVNERLGEGIKTI